MSKFSLVEEVMSSEESGEVQEPPFTEEHMGFLESLLQKTVSQAIESTRLCGNIDMGEARSLATSFLFCGQRGVGRPFLVAQHKGSFHPPARSSTSLKEQGVQPNCKWYTLNHMAKARGGSKMPCVSSSIEPQLAVCMVTIASLTTAVQIVVKRIMARQTALEGTLVWRTKDGKLTVDKQDRQQNSGGMHSYLVPCQYICDIDLY